MGFLRQLFGPSREEIWRQLCQEIGAEYVEGGFWKGDKVQVHHGHGRSPWTRSPSPAAELARPPTPAFGLPTSTRTGFRFTIYRKSIFSGLGKLLGMQDVEVGDPEFDEAFIIKGNDETKLRALFANERIRQLIEMQPRIYLTVKDDEGWFGHSSPRRGRTLLPSCGGHQGRGAAEVALLSVRRDAQPPVPHRVGVRGRPAIEIVIGGAQKQRANA